VIGQTVGRIASTALSYWVHPYRPRFTLIAGGELFHFSKWMLILNIVHFLKERSAPWVLGRIAGPTPLGTFTLAFELATLPSTEIVAPINRAVFPAYAKLAKEGIKPLRREYLSVIGVIVLLATPAVLGMAAAAPVIVPVMLGQNWHDAVPVLSLLALYGYTYIIQSNAQAAYLALGRLDVPTRLNALHTVLQLGALIPMTKYYGVVGAAASYVFTGAIMIPASLGVVLRMLDISVTRFMAEVWRSMAAAALMYAGVWKLLDVYPVPATTAAALPLLAVTVALGAIIYIGSVSLLWLACGKPASAEKVALGKLQVALRRIGLLKQPAST
jgi:O-antigen/teichoic acid export membrane protein